MDEEIAVKPARDSAASRLPVHVGIVDYKLIGTYEHTLQVRVMALVRSMLLNGYLGPAISVFQQHSDSIYNGLKEAQPTRVSLTGYGQIGVADGHHRLAAVGILDNLGLLASPSLPVQLLPVRTSGLMKMVTSEVGDRPLSTGEQPLKLSDLEACFREPGKMIPPNLTVHFDVKFEDGSYNWMRLGQPDVVIARPDFLKPGSNFDELSGIISAGEFQPGQTNSMMGKLAAAIKHSSLG